MYQQGLERLEKEGFVVEAYVDNNSKKWGSLFGGKEVVPPDTLKRGEAVALICSPQPNVVKSIAKQLESMQVEYYHIDEVIFKNHRKEILTVFDCLADEISKKTYYSVIKARIYGEYPEEGIYTEGAYFLLPQFLRRNTNEIFVDCGAYVGDSIEQFLWKKEGAFKKIIAFEPDAGNYKAMKKRISRLREEWNLKENAILTYPFALGNERSIKAMESYAENNGLGSKLVDGIEVEGNCQVVTIDEMIQDPITFLKADIESYEYKMLEGAKGSIAKWKPLLAICIYHNAVDIYSILLLIRSIVPEYKFAIRSHSYQLDETVLYAWCD